MLPISSHNLRKAIFSVAGFGSQFLPAKKAIPKELFLIVDKPLTEYTVEEAIRAEIDTFEPSPL